MLLIKKRVISSSYLYQSKVDYLTFPAIPKFSKTRLNTIKISEISLGMTANFNTNHEITKMQTKVNCPKIAKETKEA